MTAQRAVMTAVRVDFRMNRPGEATIVVPTEVHSNREMVFLDPSANYDMAFAAMSGTTTPYHTLLNNWHDDPIAMLVSGLSDIPERVRRNLMIDAAESVIHVIEKRSGVQGAELAKRVIHKCRIAASHKRTEHFAGAFREANSAMNALTHWSYSEDDPGQGDGLGRHMATAQAVGAVYCALEVLSGRVPFINSSRKAAASNADLGSFDDSSLLAQSNAYLKQESWELRRFFELMVQHAPKRVVAP
jgi:hypothetical protein